MIDIDKTARDLPRVCLHGRIPTATTMALAARVVELLARVAELEGEKRRDAQVIGQLRSRVARAEQGQRRLQRKVESYPGSGESVADMKDRWREQEMSKARVGQRGEGES